MSIDVSIVIPAHNRAELLKLTLVGLDLQEYPIDRYEVIIVDDGSEDHTEEVVTNYPAGYPLIYIKQPNQGRSAARNRGIRQAQGNVVIMTDAEAVPAPDFISQHRKHYSPDKPVIVLGKTTSILSFWDPAITTSMPPWGYIIGRAIEFSHTSPLLRQKTQQALKGEHVRFLEEEDLRADFANIQKYALVDFVQGFEKIYETYSASLEGFVVPWFLFVTVNVSTPRDLLLKVGLFDEDFSGWGLEDSDLGYRLYKAGARFFYEEAAINYHQMHPVSVRKATADHIANYSRFCKKFPTFEVFQYWRQVVGDVSAIEYNEIVKDYQENYHPEQGPAAVDYLRLSKRLAQEFIYNHRYRSDLSEGE